MIRAAIRWERVASSPERASRSRTNRSAGAITRSPTSSTCTSTKPAASTAPAIWTGVAAACVPRPQTRSCERAATSSRGPRGYRFVGMSDIESTPPGRSTRNASAKNRARDGKWNAASTLITPSNEESASGRRVASAFTPIAPAWRRRSRPATSWDRVMFTATSPLVSATSAITGSCAARPLPTSSTRPR